MIESCYLLSDIQEAIESDYHQWNSAMFLWALGKIGSDRIRGVTILSVPRSP